MRQCEKFINQRGLCLADFGFEPDPGKVEKTSDGNIVFYHYTREERLQRIFSYNSGLFARSRVDVCPNPPNEFVGLHMVEGFLEPLPKWLTDCPYFGDLGMELTRKYLGDVLLKIELPINFKGLYVADYAHHLESKHYIHRGTTPLQLEYDLNSGREVTQGYVHSYISVREYGGTHIAPVMQSIRNGQGICIPKEFITLSEKQPLKNI